MTRTPRVVVARRMAARLLRAHRGGAISLSPLEEDRCVDGCPRPFLPTAHRQALQRLWLTHGAVVIRSRVDQEARTSNLDPHLQAVLEGNPSHE